MPLLKIQTNVTVEAQRGDQLMKTASKQVATLLGKPEGFVMVVLETDVQMLFGGTPEPLAYLELKSIGLPQQQTGELSAQLCRLVSGELAVPAARVYIEFADAARSMWGWNGKTFER